VSDLFSESMTLQGEPVVPYCLVFFVRAWISGGMAPRGPTQNRGNAPHLRSGLGQPTRGRAAREASAHEKHQTPLGHQGSLSTA